VSKILDEEFKKFPEIKTSRDVHIEHRRHRYNARKDAELALADRVVVASNFVRESLISAGYPGERIWVIPSGAPRVETTLRKLDSKKFVILVAGHLSARKGTHYLLQAWRRLSPPEHVELWMVGKWLLPAAWREGLPSKVCISDTVPREKLFSLFDQANVLVFPTLAEGLALTPLEAMSRGVPVLTTPNSGADQFIRDGENGRLIRPCDVDGLANVLSWAIEHPAELYEMGMRAAATMAAWQWSDYRSQLGEKVADLVGRNVSSRKLEH
jgi:glycosyltransferase involved in cell wall biosynthesis